MTKAILIGNGVTSQLISHYTDYNMMSAMKKIIGDEYSKINNMLKPYRSLKEKDKKHICKLLEKSNIESYHYSNYFVAQGLLEEIKQNSPITSIETLIKVAKLFHHIQIFDIKNIKKCANKICYNDGKNGIENIDKKNFDKNIFANFINEFDYVFTTNFDNILDDIYNKEVCHLHGGFHYKVDFIYTAEFISKSPKLLPPEKALLVWGNNSKDKIQQTHGGNCIPGVFPSVFGSSIIQKYFNYLKNNKIDQLHIWGYSGLNDDHINSLIRENNFIREIYCYVSPEEVHSDYKLQKLNYLFNREKNHSITVCSWENLWKKFDRT